MVLSFSLSFLVVVTVISWLLLAVEIGSSCRDLALLRKRCSYRVFVEAVTPAESRRQSKSAKGSSAPEYKSSSAPVKSSCRVVLVEDD